MSISSIASQISSVDRVIHSIQQKITALEKSIHGKEKEATALLEKATKEKDIKRVIAFQRDLVKKKEDISKLEKERATKLKELSDKQKKRNDYIVQLNKEEQKERDKVKADNKELLSIQQQITREMQQRRFFTETAFAASSLPMPSTRKQYDVFVSHASDDKEGFVRGFAHALKGEGLEVWYDEFELRIGDSLRKSIDRGLRDSHYGIVVLSEHFFKKDWTQRELDGLFAKDLNGEDSVILPLWHKVSKIEVMQYSPTIAGIMALNTTDFTTEELARKIAEKVKAVS
jgi:hypothetical protein